MPRLSKRQLAAKKAWITKREKNNEPTTPVDIEKDDIAADQNWVEHDWIQSYETIVNLHEESEKDALSHLDLAYHISLFIKNEYYVKLDPARFINFLKISNHFVYLLG